MTTNRPVTSRLHGGDPAHITIREVGLREAVQVSPFKIDASIKADVFATLVRAGFTEINAAAFVHPKAMPHMSDAEEVLDMCSESGGRSEVTVSALVPNQRGLQRATACADNGTLDSAILVTATTAATLRANGMGGDVEQRIEDVLGLAAQARQGGLNTIVFVSSSFGCSVEGAVAPSVTVDIAGRLSRSEAVDEVVVSDSTGQANPWEVDGILTSLSDVFDQDNTRLGLHFHDSRGAGLANVLVALQSPFRKIAFDTSFGGWGGDIPFIPEAAGNVASEDLVQMLRGTPFDSGIDLGALLEVTREMSVVFRQSARSRVPYVGPVGWKR